MLLSSKQLAKLAHHPNTVVEAYRSFLVAPLIYQFKTIKQQILEFKPDIIVNDLLVYSTALAARALKIPDIGFCAGFKFIAPPSLTTSYEAVAQSLRPQLNHFLDKYRLIAEFQQLELVSSSYQMIFATDDFLFESVTYPENTVCLGTLPVTQLRSESVIHSEDVDTKNALIVCFGSALDPADYPDITNKIIIAAHQLKRSLIIVSRKSHLLKVMPNQSVVPYLSLTRLLAQTAVLIHHGGANTFVEALTLGTPQILIPLNNDQPIQAALLTRFHAGIAIAPEAVTVDVLLFALQRLCDPTDLLQQGIQRIKQKLSRSNGAKNAADLIEQVVTHQLKESVVERFKSSV